MLESQPEQIRDEQDRDREEYMANKWDAAGGREQTRLFANYFLDTVPLPPAETPLDISSPKGDAMPEFHFRYPNLTLFDSDISEKAISEATKAHGHIAHFEIATAESLSRQYDIIYCSNTLEHFGNYLEMARQMLAHCRWLYVLTPYQELLNGKLLNAKFRGYVADHVNTFDERSFDKLLHEDVQIKTWVCHMPGAWGGGPVTLRRRLSAFLRRQPQPLNYRQIIYQLRSPN